MEEADIRFSEVKKAQYEFNRDIVSGAVNTVSTLFSLFFLILCLLNLHVSSIW